jgi:hypothetical protein
MPPAHESPNTTTLTSFPSFLPFPFTHVHNPPAYSSIAAPPRAMRCSPADTPAEGRRRTIVTSEKRVSTIDTPRRVCALISLSLSRARQEGKEKDGKERKEKGNSP